ncbi:class I SAM-dependent methyltransferase [Salaquimonas pukyongi]|uniref:class I SAM-dependent methyltransferase n=1 Tax=Salaquimonas pukyongi TaxID=2712698 RepID=UPI0009F912D0|nr:methyltransferase [Salaquimonas pukyongi]
MDGSLPHGRAKREIPEAIVITTASRRAFILANTTIASPPHVPELDLHLAGEAHGLWHKTEEELEAIGLPPPFWAFAWAGGQGLSRFVLDHPQTVRGKRIADFAAGSGLVSIAAMKAGASSALAMDIDPFCKDAIALNSALNGVEIAYTDRDLLALEPEAGAAWLAKFDCILAGDVFYDRQMAHRLWPLFCTAAEAGIEILAGDPGRTYLPKEGLSLLAEYQVPVTRALEDNSIKQTRVWRVTGLR